MTEKRDTARQRYPSDLTEAQWRQVDLLLPGDSDTGRRRVHDLREIVNAVNYRWTTGCVWRMLPHDLPPWGTVYRYFRAWQRDGLLREIRQVLISNPHTPQVRLPQVPATTNPNGPRRDGLPRQPGRMSVRG